MTKRLPTILLLLIFILININAQNLPQNQLQLNHSLYFFKGVKTKYKPLINLPFSIAYNRITRSENYLFGVNLYHYIFSDHNHEEMKERGDVVSKGFIIITANVGYRLGLTPRRTFLAKLGLAYRHGYEQQHYSVLNVGGRLEVFSTDYKYRDPGIELTAEQQFHLNKLWSVSLGGGYQYFLTRTTTNHQLWVSLGLGKRFGKQKDS
jgi:hypothetical protein